MFLKPGLWVVPFTDGSTPSNRRINGCFPTALRYIQKTNCTRLGQAVITGQVDSNPCGNLGGIMNRIPVAYGYWKSAITPKTLGARTPLYDVQWNRDGTSLVWLEQRSDTGVLVCRRGNEAPYDLTDGHPVRGGVGYGGGDFTAANDFVVFAEKDGRLYRQSLSPGPARTLTPAFGGAASPVVSPDGRWVLYVHTCESVDVIALVDSDGSGWPVNLVRGADFYMQPAWHPDGERIAWIEWDQPQMPWDGTRLKTARLDSDRRSVNEELLIAGDTDTPVFQPAFSPDGRWLSYIETEEEWDSLVVMDLATGERRVLVDGTTLADPAWVQGMRVYGWAPDSETLYYRRHERGFASLWTASVATGRNRKMETPQYTWMLQVAVSPTRNTVACIASSSTIPERVVTMDGNAHTVHRRSQSEMIPEADLSIPVSISWPTPGGEEVHGLYYPPRQRPVLRRWQTAGYRQHPRRPHRTAYRRLFGRDPLLHQPRLCLSVRESPWKYGLWPRLHDRLA